MTSEWCKEIGLSLNPRKTVIVPFTNRCKLQRMKAIPLSECRIEASNENKYLGITLDSKLSFKTHVGNTIDKCTRALFTCRNIAGTHNKMAVPHGSQTHTNLWGNSLG